jgi:hypothetical protein
LSWKRESNNINFKKKEEIVCVLTNPDFMESKNQKFTNSDTHVVMRWYKSDSQFGKKIEAHETSCNSFENSNFNKRTKSKVLFFSQFVLHFMIEKTENFLGRQQKQTPTTWEACYYSTEHHEALLA